MDSAAFTAVLCPWRKQWGGELRVTSSLNKISMDQLGKRVLVRGEALLRPPPSYSVTSFWIDVKNDANDFPPPICFMALWIWAEKVKVDLNLFSSLVQTYIIWRSGDSLGNYWKKKKTRILKNLLFSYLTFSSLVGAGLKTLPGREWTTARKIRHFNKYFSVVTNMFWLSAVQVFQFFPRKLCHSWKRDWLFFAIFGNSIDLIFLYYRNEWFQYSNFLRCGTEFLCVCRASFWFGIFHSG